MNFSCKLASLSVPLKLEMGILLSRTVCSIRVFLYKCMGFGYLNNASYLNTFIIVWEHWGSVNCIRDSLVLTLLSQANLLIVSHPCPHPFLPTASNFIIVIINHVHMYFYARRLDIEKIPDRLVDSSKHLSINRMAAGSRLPRSSHGIFSPFY